MTMTTTIETAARWLRVSSGGQDEANQEPDVEAYCAAKGYADGPVYTVHAKSAFHGDHQADLDQALADARAGRYQVLVIWHSDRLERRERKALLDVLAEFEAAGVRVESVQEPTLGHLDFGGQVLTFITGLVNHEKSAHISAQVGLAHGRIRENMALQGRPPWGYTTGGTKYHRMLLPTPEGMKYVPRGLPPGGAGRGAGHRRALAGQREVQGPGRREVVAEVPQPGDPQSGLHGPAVRPGPEDQALWRGAASLRGSGGRGHLEGR